MDETTSLYTQIRSGRWFLDKGTVAAYADHRVAINAYPTLTGKSTMSNQDESATLGITGRKIDLGAMPSLRNLIGREDEFQTLQQWLADPTCRLIAIGGVNGQGKSALAASLTQKEVEKTDPPADTRRTSFLDVRDSKQVEDWPLPTTKEQYNSIPSNDRFSKIIWRSLAFCPSYIELLQDLVQQLCPEESRKGLTNINQLTTLFFTALAEKRCLIVLDGVEALLADDTKARTEAKAYDHLFELVVKRHHQSCLLLTSRVRSSVLSRLQNSQEPVRLLELQGLTAEQSNMFLAAHGINTRASHHGRLYERYVGNPRMLSQAALLVHDLFAGDIAAFLEEEIQFLDHTEDTLARQLANLPPLQREILRCLMASNRPLTRQQLWALLSSETTQKAFHNALYHLQQLYLIHQTDGVFTAVRLPTMLL